MDYYKKLNLYVDLQELNDYFKIVETTYADKKWSVHKFKDQITEKKWRTFTEKPNQDSYGGWAIDSNLVDLDAVCPPLNESISNLPKLDYERPTALSFGVVARLKEKIPFAYKWAILAQPTGGKTFKHNDGDEYVTHIMIRNNPDCIFKFYKSEEEFLEFNIPTDGHLYTLNTPLQHETWNNGPERFSLIFVIKKEDLPALEALSGKV